MQEKQLQRYSKTFPHSNPIKNMITTKAHSNNAHLSCSCLLSLYSFVQRRGENRNVWLYCIEPARGVCQSMHATQWAWRDWCFCHPPASKLWKKKKRKSSRLMQVEKPSQAGSQTKEGEPHCSSFCSFFKIIIIIFFYILIWDLSSDSQWAQINSESCVRNG